jgi:hypothetical protein
VNSSIAAMLERVTSDPTDYEAAAKLRELIRPASVEQTTGGGEANAPGLSMTTDEYEEVLVSLLKAALTGQGPNNAIMLVLQSTGDPRCEALFAHVIGVWTGDITHDAAVLNALQGLLLIAHETGHSVLLTSAINHMMAQGTSLQKQEAENASGSPV